MGSSSNQLELFFEQESSEELLGSEIHLQEDLSDTEGDERRKGSELSLEALDEECLLEHVRQWLQPLLLKRLIKQVQVKWNSRLQTTAGRAHYRESRIELNPKLIALADVAEIERTLKHELAHLVAYERCGKLRRRKLQPHGIEWRQACADLGIAGESRCHELALPGRQMQRKFSYACPACEVVILRVRRFKGYVSCYSCCRKQSGGRYDKRFQLVEERL